MFVHFGMLVYPKRLHSYNFSLAGQRITIAARLKNRCNKLYLGTLSGKFKVNGPKGDYEL